MPVTQKSLPGIRASGTVPFYRKASLCKGTVPLVILAKIEEGDDFRSRWLETVPEPATHYHQMNEPHVAAGLVYAGRRSLLHTPQCILCNCVHGTQPAGSMACILLATWLERGRNNCVNPETSELYIPSPVRVETHFVGFLYKETEKSVNLNSNQSLDAPAYRADLMSQCSVCAIMSPRYYACCLHGN